MNMKWQPHELRKVLMENLPELQDKDCFISGGDIHFCLWGIQSPMDSTLEFIGMHHEVPDFLAQSQTSYRLHATLRDYELFLVARPFDFQRYAYSVRLDSAFRGKTITSPKNLRCSKRVDEFSDRKLILNLCVNVRQKLSRICSRNQFHPLGMQECIDAGLFQWLTEHSFVGYFLEDLCSGSFLDQDLRNWLEAGLMPLIWFEKEVQSRQGAWDNLMETMPENRSSLLDLRAFKPGFFFQFLETEFLDFSSLDQDFFNCLKGRPDWWLNTLVGERLDYHMMSQWCQVFHRNYLQGFILSCLKTIHGNDLNNYSWIRFMDLIFEIFSEERTILEFFHKAGLERPEESDNRFLHLMGLRFNQEIRSLRQFKLALEDYEERAGTKKPVSSDTGFIGSFQK